MFCKMNVQNIIIWNAYKSVTEWCACSIDQICAYFAIRISANRRWNQLNAGCLDGDSRRMVSGDKQREGKVFKTLDTSGFISLLCCL